MKRFLRKHEGYSWLLGMYMIIAILMLMLMVMSWYRVSGDSEIAEDKITASALGSMLYDRPSYALDNEPVISEFVKRNCENYNSLCSLLSANFGYENIPYGMNGINVAGFRIKSTDAYLLGGEATIYLPRVIYYCKNPQNGKWMIHEYTGNGTGVTKRGLEQTSTPVSPDGTVIEKTSCYVELVYPVRFMGVAYDSIKSMTVALT